MGGVPAVNLLSSEEGLGVHGGGGCREEAMLASWGGEARLGVGGRADGL